MEDNKAEKTVIGGDVEVVGSVKCSGNIEFNGKLNGDLNSSADALLGKNAIVKGNLSVNCISVNGHVTGNISAKDRVELKASAVISGDIKAKRMTVEDGVSFIGKAEVNPAGRSLRSDALSAGIVDMDSMGTDDAKSKTAGMAAKK
jgi:cytoskeletal protein CcmA (bactofilin family)